ncbi:MAG: acetyl-CoA hydrolase/transferase C-terminal domain-containing protein, partial [Pseudonocardia sp.]
MRYSTTPMTWSPPRSLRWAAGSRDMRRRPFVAINSALQVDLLGQVVAEVADDRIVGGVAGQVDPSVLPTATPTAQRGTAHGRPQREPDRPADRG